MLYLFKKFKITIICLVPIMELDNYNTQHELNNEILQDQREKLQPTNMYPVPLTSFVFSACIIS